MRSIPQIMKTTYLLFASAALSLAGCSTMNTGGAKNDSETVLVTYHVQSGKEADFQKLLLHAWDVYRSDGLVYPKPHVIVRNTEDGNKTSFTEIFTWARSPDHPSDDIRALWSQEGAMLRGAQRPSRHRRRRRGTGHREMMCFIATSFPVTKLTCAAIGFGLIIGFFMYQILFKDLSGLKEDVENAEAQPVLDKNYDYVENQWSNNKIMIWLLVSVGSGVLAYYRLPELLPHWFHAP